MLELHLLGKPRVAIDSSTADSSVLLNKDLALLYYLAATGQRQSRTALAVLLWGDLSDSAARTNLRKSLHNLHRRLGDHIQIARSEISLASGRCRVDLWQFEQQARTALAAGSAHQLQAAVDLYAGDFLAGFSVRGAPDFDLWQYNTQERLRSLAVQLLAALAAQHAGAGSLAAAIAAQRRILELEPWREEAHRQLMLLLARSGQRSAAAAQYKACVAVLKAELGVEPGAETLGLYARIRDDQVEVTAQPELAVYGPPAAAAPAPVRTNLPPELTPIVGRAAELDELATLLADPACRLITLLGPGGIGKTRLALALAHRLAARYEAVFLAPLAAVDSPGAIWPAIGRTLNLTAAVGDSEAVLTALRSSSLRLLLVLDNFEQLLPDGVRVLEELLMAAPLIQCVVTSREALNALWEWRYDLMELSFPADWAATRLGDYSAIQLFLQIARRTRSHRPIQPAELPQIARICQLVGGMPLGIELAAAQVSRLPCAVIADQLAAGLDRLRVELHDLPERQRSLLAGFETSWASLSAGQQEVLARLSVLRSDFTFAAAVAVAGATIADLIRLVDKSLVRVRGIDLYDVHEVIRRFAADKLALIPGAPDEVFARYREYYVSIGIQGLEPLIRFMEAAPDPVALLSSYLRHAWYIWGASADLPDQTDIAVALAPAEQAAHGYYNPAAVSWDTFKVLHDRLDEFTQGASLLGGATAVDIAWLAMIAEDLVDLSVPFAAELDDLFGVLQDNCRYSGKLVAFPYYLELGLLYYRSDLLAKYGFPRPPRTWAELEEMATVIQAGERAAGHGDFWGFIWHGHLSESLACCAVEWLHSEGGGSIIEADGRVSVANPRAAAALTRAARWVGAISPPNFAEFSEDYTVRHWETGNAAFMRLWTGVYDIRSRPVVGPLTENAVLPRGSVRHAATLGGWPLAVLNVIKERTDAIQLIREIASPKAQRIRALLPQAYPPSRRSLYGDPAILARHAYLADVLRLVDDGGLALRPTRIAGALYPQVSAAFASAVAAVLSHQVDADTALTRLERTLVELGGWRR